MFPSFSPLLLGNNVTPAEPPALPVGFFSNANNAHIHGGQFMSIGYVNNASPSSWRNSKDPFQHLQEHVSTSAFHNSGKRVDPPRCHENTRTAVIQDIFSWILQESVRTTWILWLNGAAGAGKTAIGQSIAELCVARGILVASFFFFRTDPTRNSILHVVATLAYQLIQLVPMVKDLILEIIESNPLIFQQSFESQFEALIIRPLIRLQLSDISWRLLLIVDGINDCEGDDNQANLIRKISRILGGRNLPVIVMFSSRAENKLKMVFKSPRISDILLQVPLDDHYLPDDDIRLFISDSFAEIRQTHPFSYLLDHDWPTEDLVDDIVAKSSGQFIYASVVMNFTSSPNCNPTQQLDIVRGLRSSVETPFAPLDALYRHVFSCVHNLRLVTSILAYVILGDDANIFSLARLMGLPQSDLDIALAPLSSVITCRKNQYEPASITFLHASLPDFLLDETRSGAFHINVSEWCTYFTTLWFRTVASEQRRGMYHSDHCDVVLRLLRKASASNDLRESIRDFTPAPVYCDMLVDLLHVLKTLELDDEGEVYRHQLVKITRFFWNNRLDYIAGLLEEHDVYIVMSTAEEEMKETHDAQEQQAKKDSDRRKETRQKFEKQLAANQKARRKTLEDQEEARRRTEKERYELQEGRRREVDRREYNMQEMRRREADKNQYNTQEASRRDADRNQYNTQEVSRREAERSEYVKQEMERREADRRLYNTQEAELRAAKRLEFDMQEAARREEIRREEERKAFEAQEEARREAERQAFEEQEAARREAAKREFDIQEAARREEAKKQFDIQEAERREASLREASLREALDRKSSKPSLWSRLAKKR